MQKYQPIIPLPFIFTDDNVDYSENGSIPFLLFECMAKSMLNMQTKYDLEAT